MKADAATMGSAEALWHLARPKMWPYIMMLVGAGYGWAHWDRALMARSPDRLLFVLAAWTLLHAGTLWLNASVDQDEGEVLFGRSVPPPPHTAAVGYVALLATVGLAACAGLGPGLVALVCVVLSVLYSHPRTMWKGHPLGGPFVNFVGYGLACPLVGFLVVGVPANPRSVVAWLLLAVAILGMYFAAQAFQGEEDRSRGYRTLVATHGSRTVISAARLCINLAIAGGILLALIGWLPRSCLICVPGWWVLDRWLVQWGREPDGGSAEWARGFTSRLLVVGLSGVLAAFVSYANDSFAHRPVAGLGTVAGRPSDRPLLPPSAMRSWEALNADGGATSSPSETLP